MAQRPNRLPTSLRERTLNMDPTRNKLSSPSQSAQQQKAGNSSSTVAYSVGSGATSVSSSAGGGANSINSHNANQTELKSDTADKLSTNQTSNSTTNNGGGSDLTNSGNSSLQASNSSASARKTSSSPAPSPSPSPGLAVRSSNSRSSSPKRGLIAEESEKKAVGQDFERDLLSELAPNSTPKNQNRFSAPGFIRVGNSSANLSDSRESLPSSKSSGGSMDSKDEKEGKPAEVPPITKKSSFFKRRKSSKDVLKGIDHLSVVQPAGESNGSNRNSYAAGSDDTSSSSRSHNSFHHSQSLPDCVKHEEAALGLSGGATPNQLSASPGSDKEKSSREKNSSKRKSAPWLSGFSSNYKSKCEEFNKTFKTIPDNARLVVDYSCALQKDILVQGRLYVTEEWLCFYANIFKWETLLTIRLKEITGIKKERSIRIIPNAIQIETETEKYFFTSFMSRDKTYLLLFRVWQNALIGQTMSPDEYWTRVHANYGSNLGLSTEELPDDYVKPSGVITIENGDDIDDSIDDDFKDEAQDEGDLDDMFPQDAESQDLSYSEGSVSVSMSSAAGAESPVNLTHNVPLPRSVSMESAPPGEEEVEVEPLCPDEYSGKEYHNFVYNIPVDQMAEALFADSHSFYKEFLHRRGHTDIDITTWEKKDEKDEKCDTRKICYTYNMPGAIGPKSCGIIETHTMRKDWCQQGHSYINDLDIRQKGVPYCDYFYSSARQTLTRVSSTSCRLRVQCSLIYVKNAWGFVKNFIEKNSESGTKETHKVLDIFIRERLENSAYPAHMKKRRPRKRRGVPLPSKEESENRMEKRRSDAHIEGPETFWLSRAANKVLPTCINSRLGFLGDTRNLMLIICLLLFLLSIFNVSLFMQLRSLEDKSVHRQIWSPEEMAAKLGALPKNNEEWSTLLQQQQYYHDLELNKWKDVVGLCIQLIKQMESTLSELHSGLHHFKAMPDVEELKKAMKVHPPGEL